MSVKEEQEVGNLASETCGLAPLAEWAVGHESQAAMRSRGMEEHPLFEQGNACPAIRLPLQQFEAMDKAFRSPVAPRQS